MLQIQFDQNDVKRLQRLPDNGQKIIQMTLQRAGNETMEGAKKESPYLSGNLRRSITMSPQIVGKGASKVTVGTNLVYARIQDQGGTITPKKSRFLRFKTKDGRWVMAKKVVIKGNKYMTHQYERMKNGRAQQILNEEYNRNILK